MAGLITGRQKLFGKALSAANELRNVRLIAPVFVSQPLLANSLGCISAANFRDCLERKPHISPPCTTLDLVSNVLLLSARIEMRRVYTLAVVALV